MKLDNHTSNKLDLYANRPIFTLGITSQLSDIHAHSIRQYIDRGLLIPFKLSSKRHLFSQNDISRLKNIHMLIHEEGLNFAGIRALMAMIPCWAIRECSKKDRQICQAYTANSRPCWEASEKGRLCKNDNCRMCDVYLSFSKEIDLKSMIKALI